MVVANTVLKNFTTMKTGGIARYFFTARNSEEVKEAVLFARKNNIPFFVLGGGSNVVISDSGFGGVVVKVEIGGMKFYNTACGVRVVAGAGVPWDDLVSVSVEKNLYGLENLSFIPGTVGASPVQNIGAYGSEVGETIAWVEVLNTQTLEVTKIQNVDCCFGYRDSIFKSSEGKKYIILSVAFDLKKDGELKIGYKDIQEYFKERNTTNLSVKDVRDAVGCIRSSKLPDVKKVGCAGSFFKNPLVSEEILKCVLRNFPDIKFFPQKDKMFKLSAAYLIDRIGGWKGVCERDVCAYEKQPLVLVNRGAATAQEVLSFAEKIREDIFSKTKIKLEFEVNII